MTYTWKNRAYVNEPKITPEEYKMFFGHDEFGIKYDIANLILAENAKGDYDEVVPCDELNDWSREQIAKDARFGVCSGLLEYNGQAINWKWDPEITDDDGQSVNMKDVPIYVLDRILTQMLDNEAHWGIVDV